MTGKLGLKAQSVVRLAIHTLKLIQDHDIAWHQAIFDESIAYIEVDRRELLDLYRSWYRSAKKLATGLGVAALSPPDARDLQSNLAEVKSCLTPDDEFLKGPS